MKTLISASVIAFGVLALPAMAEESDVFSDINDTAPVTRAFDDLEDTMPRTGDYFEGLDETAPHAPIVSSGNGRVRTGR